MGYQCAGVGVPGRALLYVFNAGVRKRRAAAHVAGLAQRAAAPVGAGIDALWASVPFLHDNGSIAIFYKTQVLGAIQSFNVRI